MVRARGKGRIEKGNICIVRTQEVASAYLLYTQRRIKGADVRCKIGLEEERDARRGVKSSKGEGETAMRTYDTLRVDQQLFE